MAEATTRVCLAHHHKHYPLLSILFLSLRPGRTCPLLEFARRQHSVLGLRPCPSQRDAPSLSFFREPQLQLCQTTSIQRPALRRDPSAAAAYIFRAVSGQTPPSPSPVFIREAYIPTISSTLSAFDFASPHTSPEQCQQCQQCPQCPTTRNKLHSGACTPALRRI